MSSDEFLQRQINEVKEDVVNTEHRVVHALKQVDANKELINDLLNTEKSRVLQQDRIELSLLALRKDMPTPQAIDDILTAGLALRVAKGALYLISAAAAGLVAWAGSEIYDMWSK
jgi:hypothetical protein